MLKAWSEYCLESERAGDDLCDDEKAPGGWGVLPSVIDRCGRPLLPLDGANGVDDGFKGMFDILGTACAQLLARLKLAVALYRGKSIVSVVEHVPQPAHTSDA